MTKSAAPGPRGRDSGRTTTRPGAGEGPSTQRRAGVRDDGPAPARGKAGPERPAPARGKAGPEDRRGAARPAAGRTGAKGRGKAGPEDRYEKTGRAGARGSAPARRGKPESGDTRTRSEAGPRTRSEAGPRTRSEAGPRTREAGPRTRSEAGPRTREAGPRTRSEAGPEDRRPGARKAAPDDRRPARGKPGREDRPDSARRSAPASSPARARGEKPVREDRSKPHGAAKRGVTAPTRGTPGARPGSRQGARAKALPKHGTNPGPTARASKPAPPVAPAAPAASKVSPATAREFTTPDDDDDDDDEVVEVEPTATPARAAKLRDVEARLLAAADAAQAAEHAASRPKADATRPAARRPQPPPAFNVEEEPEPPARTPGVARDVRGWTDGKAPPRREPSARPVAPARPAKPAKPAQAAKADKPRGTPERLAPTKIRLQKVLASAGVAARRKAEDLITGRRVTVNGRIVDELGAKVDPDRDQIKVNGKVVQVEKKVYFVLNKPDGVVCSAEGTKDAEGRPTVLSLLPAVTQRVYPVGRLDFHSRGVLIMTNDGELAAALTHPRHEVAKTYHVKFQGRLDDDALAALGRGITLEDGTVTRPAEEVSVIKETSTNTWVQITLRQGLNRQIRRMGDALGHPVLKLIRVAVGAVTADGLADGEFRPLTPTEVYDLMAAALR